ncbi:hypothetical protein N566_22830 [Streptomycetaceae bacterium MP113-05]|nr:hypothetical protein N566_22830 [Streptomycetaceae bacterium MP113-05]
MAEGVHAASSGVGEEAGVYRYDVAEGTWWWSDEVFRMHGLTPHEAIPTTELLLEYKHPEDRDDARKCVEGCLSDGEPFSCYHRIVSADGSVRRLVVVGDGETDAAGRVSGIRGFFIDVTDPVNEQIREVSDGAITAARNSQESIDQARGIIMGVYGVGADAALALLRRHSQHTNTRLRDLAEALVEAAPSPPGSPRTDLRRRLESALYAGARPGGVPSHRPGARPTTSDTRTDSVK